MNLEKIKDKLLFQMTGKEFLFLQEQIQNLTDLRTEDNNFVNKKYVYGIKGIAELFGCSISSANRIKKKGIIKDAIIQDGRKIIIDAELAISLMKENNQS